jgi:predicted nucleic acid-binding protein
MVVADSSPLNYLNRLGHPDGLQEIFGPVLAPDSVLIEMQHRGKLPRREKPKAKI